MRHVGLNGSTESNQRGPGAFYTNRPQRSMRAASGGAGRSIRGGGTRAVNHPKGSGHSGASSIRAFPSFSIYNSLVLVSIGLLLSLMFFWLLAVVITIMGHCLFLVFTMWLCSWKLWVKNKPKSKLHSSLDLYVDYYMNLESPYPTTWYVYFEANMARNKLGHEVWHPHKCGTCLLWLEMSLLLFKFQSFNDPVCSFGWTDCLDNRTGISSTEQNWSPSNQKHICAAGHILFSPIHLKTNHQTTVLLEIKSVTA